jgi:type I restriction enzyme S subunit
MAINQDLKALSANKHMDKEFLPWLLKGAEPETLNRLDEAGHGTKALRMDAWGAMLIPVPPLEEQTAIASFILRETTRLDALMAEAQSAITLLQERRSALISAVVTGQIDVRQALPA